MFVFFNQDFECLEMFLLSCFLVIMVALCLNWLDSAFDIDCLDWCRGAC